MYRKQLRRRRAVLAFLILSSFALLTATYGQGSGGLQQGVATIFSPLEKGADRALKPARDLVNWFDETFDARGENKKLKDQLAVAQQQATAGEVAVQQNNQFTQLLGVNRSGVIPSGYSRVTGEVIGKSPSAWYSTVTIDIGSSDGVAVDDPVINGEGLVGSVAAVTHGSAVITLITDPDSRVSGKIARNGTQGVVTPVVGDPSDLTLEFLDSAKDIQRGQPVVTAGWRGDGVASHFPPNLLIGLVTQAPLSQQEAAQQVHLTPSADIANLDFVEVLTGGDR
jgi:rod shape-determining protein MreC